VGEIVNTIRGLGEKVEYPVIVQKVLIFLPLIFYSKVFTIEDPKNLEKPTMDELHGILTAYEMKTKESYFKASKKTKGHKFCDCSSHESDL
jgi:hypothetical protein